MANLDDLLKGNTPLAQNSGSFQKVREIVAKLLRSKGESAEFTTIAAHVQQELKYANSQKAYNYLHNAIKKDTRFHAFKYGSRRLIVRVDGDLSIADDIKRVLAQMEKGG